MVDLSDENRVLCFQDSVPKPLYIFLYYWKEEPGTANDGYWEYFKTIDEAIVLESMELEEGILEGNYFELGSLVMPTLKVQWRNDGLRYRDMIAVPVQQIGDECIAYFDGYVSNEEISDDGQIVTAEISSFLSKRLNIDVLEAMRSYSNGTFANILYETLALVADIWVEDFGDDFANGNTKISFDTFPLPKKFTSGELIKQAAEFLGANVVIKEKRRVDLNDMKTYMPFATPKIQFIKLSSMEKVKNHTSLNENGHIQKYRLPYFINLNIDKPNRISVDALTLTTQNGEQKYYYLTWTNTPDKKEYQIKDNLFFEALSVENKDKCGKAVENVAEYFAELDYYYSELSCVYPPFVEGGDYLLVNNNKHQIKLPNGYMGVECILLGENASIDTLIAPNSNNIELNITFSHFGQGVGAGLTSDGRNSGYDTIKLYIDGNKLIGQVGYYGGSIQANTFEVPFVPNNQKIDFTLKCGKGQYNYSGTFNGNGEYWGSLDSIITKSVMQINGNQKIYHFSYSQNGQTLRDMYPCVRESDGLVGMYDIVHNDFHRVDGEENPKYETSEIIVPVLSITTRGINSMKSDIFCKATHIKN